MNEVMSIDKNKLHKKLVDSFKLNESTFKRALTSLNETLEKKKVYVNKAVGVYSNRQFKHHEEIQNKVDTINKNNESFEKKIKSLENKYSLEHNLNDISATISKELEQVKSAYSKQRNEFLGKITIVEKDLVIALKELNDKSSDEEKALKQKFFDLEKKVIQDINSIQELIMFPEGSTYKLDPNLYLMGNKETRVFHEDICKAKRIEGINSIKNKTISFLEAKRDYEINLYSNSVKKDALEKIMKNDADMKILEFRKILETVEGDLKRGEDTCDNHYNELAIELKNKFNDLWRDESVKVLEKNMEVNRHIYSEFKHDLTDRLNIIDEVCKLDLSLLESIKTHLSIPKKGLAKFRETFLDYSDLGIDLLDIYKEGLVLTIDDIKSTERVLLNHLPSGNYSFDKVDDISYSLLTSEINFLIEELDKERDRFLEKYFKKLEKQRKKVYKDINRLSDIIDSFINYEESLEDKLFNGVNNLIVQYKNNLTSSITSIHNHNLDSNNNELDNIRLEYEAALSQNWNDYNHRKQEINDELASFHSAYNSKINLINQDESEKRSVLDDKIMNINLNTILINSTLESDIHKCVLDTEKKYSDLIKKENIEAANNLKRI